jgi:hypothetical protein
MIKIINQSKDKGTVIFSMNGRTLCEYIDSFSSEESEAMNLFEPIDLGGEWEHERGGFEYSADNKYPDYKELHEGQVIELLEQMHKDFKGHGFATKQDMIDEQFLCYQGELKRISAIRKALKSVDKLVNWAAA